MALTPIRFAPGLLEVMRAEAAAWAPLETGWVAIGCGDTVALLVPAGPRTLRTPVAFQPDLEFVEAAITAIRGAIPGAQPLAVIHSHPRGPQRPSGQDADTVRETCAEFGVGWLDIGICARRPSGAFGLRIWRYLADEEKFVRRRHAYEAPAR
jgi:hypothetical protein